MLCHWSFLGVCHFDDCRECHGVAGVCHRQEPDEKPPLLLQRGFSSSWTVFAPDVMWSGGCQFVTDRWRLRLAELGERVGSDTWGGDTAGGGCGAGEHVEHTAGHGCTDGGDSVTAAAVVAVVRQ